MNADLVTRLIDACKDKITRLKKGESELVLGDVNAHEMAWFAERFQKEVRGEVLSQRLDGHNPYDQVDLSFVKDGPHIKVFTPLAYLEIFHPDIYHALTKAYLIENGILFVQRNPESTLADRILEIVKEIMPKRQGISSPLIVANLTREQGYSLMSNERFNGQKFSVGIGSGSPSLPDYFRLTIDNCMFDSSRPSVDVQTPRYLVETTRELWRQLERLAILDAASKNISYIGNKKVVTVSSNDIVARIA